MADRAGLEARQARWMQERRAEKERQQAQAECGAGAGAEQVLERITERLT